MRVHLGWLVTIQTRTGERLTGGLTASVDLILAQGARALFDRLEPFLR